jgi:uncharacterized RDD family membrane protein YckC
MTQSANPYAAPTGPSRLEDLESETRRFPTASKGIRFVNYLLDSVALWIVNIVWGIIALAMFPPTAEVPLDEVPTFDIVATLLSIGVFLVYYIAMEATFGQTLGKMITRTTVVNEDGNKPSFGQVLGRSFARLIPFEPLSVLLKGNARGWHDSLPGTYVVKKR